MLYAPINTLVEMSNETFRDNRRPLNDDAVAELAWTQPDTTPNRLGLAFIRLVDGIVRFVRPDRAAVHPQG